MVVAAPTFSAPTEGILLEVPSTKLIVNDQELGSATLYITEHNVVWGGGVSPSGTAVSTITLMYPMISVHAIQREPTTCLYLIVNYDLKLPELTQQGAGDMNQDEDDDEDEDFYSDNQPITQLRFIPESENELQAMFSAMSQGQSLNPDPDEQLTDDDNFMDGEELDEVEDEFEDAEESNATPEDATSRLRQLRIENANGHQEEAEDAEIEE